MNPHNTKAIVYKKYGPLQKCPYNTSVLIWVFRSGQMVFGTVGLTFLNIWVAAIYLLYTFAFTFWAWPVKHCKYCYYNVNTIDKKNGKTIRKLLTVDEWKESYLTKHVDCGKKLFPPLSILLWIFPIVLIVISFFWNFSVIALLSLIGFIVLLGAQFLYVKWKVCPTCAFMEECHASF